MSAPSPGTAPGRRREEGQATVELALALPLLFSLVLLVVQSGLVLRDQVLLVHAARQAARVAAIEGDAARGENAGRIATVLRGDRLDVRVDRAGGDVRAELRYRSTIVVPLLRRVLPDVELSAAVTMHDESSASAEET